MGRLSKVEASARLRSWAAETERVEVLAAQDVFASFDEIEARGINPQVTMLDPWYNKGVGGIDASYDIFIHNLLQRACAISPHVYLWGFPEVLAPFTRSQPSSHELVAWLTWYYKNNPSVIRGWRSAQQTCLHFATPGAPLYPEHFINSIQREKLAQGKLRYMPGPASVIEASLNIGFVGKKEQTGHPAQKPMSVFDRLIRMVTLEDDLIFDPMCGSGTSGAVAIIRNRRAILCDANSDYLRITGERLASDLSSWGAKLDLEVNNRESTGAPLPLL
jgi:hypothetical protein